jgi:hypothetical protein
MPAEGAFSRRQGWSFSPRLNSAPLICDRPLPSYVIGRYDRPASDSGVPPPQHQQAPPSLGGGGPFSPGQILNREEQGLPRHLRLDLAGKRPDTSLHRHAVGLPAPPPGRPRLEQEGAGLRDAADGQRRPAVADDERPGLSQSLQMAVALAG